MRQLLLILLSLTFFLNAKADLSKMPTSQANGTYEDNPFAEFERINKVTQEEERKQALQELIKETFTQDFQPPQNLEIKINIYDFTFAFFTKDKKDKDLVCKGELTDQITFEENRKSIKKYKDIRISCRDRSTGQITISDLTRGWAEGLDDLDELIFQ